MTRQKWRLTATEKKPMTIDEYLDSIGPLVAFVSSSIRITGTVPRAAKRTGGANGSNGTETIPQTLPEPKAF